MNVAVSKCKEERLRVSQYESEEEAIAIRWEQERRRNDSQQREFERDTTLSQPTLFEVCDADDLPRAR